VRLQQYIGRDHFAFEFRVFALVPRILVTAHVPPWPAVEAALLDVSDVVRNKVIAERVPLIDRAPQLASLGIDRDAASRVANSPGINFHAGAVGIEFKNISAILLLWTVINV